MTARHDPPTPVGTGQPVRRLEDARLLTGQGRFTADRSPASVLHACFVRSPYAHAQIRSIDASAARAMPGVVAIYTGADLNAAGVGALLHAPRLDHPDGGPMRVPPRLALAADTVRFAGEAVAVVVAASRFEAEDAAENVAVEWGELPAVTDVAAATEIAARHAHGDAVAVDAAFAGAAHVVRLTLRNNRLVPSALEPRAAIAEVDAGKLTLRIGCQMPHLARDQLATAILKMDPADVRVVVEDIGGGFGSKSFLYPEYVAVAFAARALGRSVKWVGTRSEAFLADTHGRDQLSDAALALDAAGRFLALRVRTRANLGAYASFLGAVIPTVAGLKPLAGAYTLPLVHAQVDVMLTNTSPVEAYRGAGRPESIYVLERLIDAAATVVGIDALELRRRNFIAAREMPYRTAMGEVYDSGDFARLFERALDASDWAGFAARRAAAERDGLLLGRGLAYFIESTGAANPIESAAIEARADGSVIVYSGTQNMGQGLETAYAQLVAERLRVAIERVRLVQGDTAQVARGGGSGGSRSLYVGGSAIAAACTALLERAEGEDLVTAAVAAGGALRAEGKVKVSGFSWPNGCHVCEVAIERETGVARVTRFTAVDDVGVVVNPLIVHGQTHGALAQGIGQALIEDCRYDAASGQLLSGSFLDYALPRADDLPSFEVETDESAPCTTNPLGAKGAGEGGTIGAPPAVVSALLDALAPWGVAHLDMPVRAETLWRIVRGSVA